MLALVAAALPMAMGASEAQNLLREVRIGVLAHDVPGLWSGFRLETTSPDLNIEAVFNRSVPFLGGHIRPVLGGTVNFDGGTSKGYVDARWEIETRSGLFFGLGIGAGVHSGYLGVGSVDHKALGSRVLFHIPAEIGYRFDAKHSVSLYFEHYSNASTRKYNEGIDGLGARYGYRF